MSLKAIKPEFWELVDQSATLERVGTGYQFTEGPIWHPVDRYLLFSDMPGDVRRRFGAEGIAEVKRPSNKGNGMTYDADLNLIVCEHATSSLVRERPGGGREVLASHYEGRELNSPNDTCVRSDGSIYFTDPWYGRMPVFGVERPRQLHWQGVFRVPPGGGGREPQLVVGRDDFDMPNGLCFSPDEKLLYINDTRRFCIRVYDVQPDGHLSNGRVFADRIVSEDHDGVPDGMKCDARGNIWLTAPYGLWIYNPAGELIGKLAVPELAANLTWGGSDWRTLFITASTSLYVIPTRVGPRVEPYMRTSAPRTAAASGQTSSPTSAASGRASAPAASSPGLKLDPARCALIIQDMQNDVMMDGGAFAESGSPQHARDQNVVENIRRLADVCRTRGIPVIHVWFVVEPGAPGMTFNAPLFEGLRDARAMERGTWGAASVKELAPKPGDHIVEKRRMSAWEGSALETVLKATGRDTIIDTGAWTNMSIEHTARTGADKGYYVIVPEDCCSTMNAEWHNASINFAMQNVATVTNADEVIAALGG
ncbi:isochorismatase family protein [Microbaculum marinum]|uniref:Isochorismatase family protein n=1 Tax=Microbaculum marinum TaxID=1764581 RepID=A0AAW9RRE5_9HYPH